ncbi:outer membrane protein transport protein [Candidatus Aminicenantes bacterium AH-873-B07]|jgi:long-chain fatty acid transport protein|nr:outer membrane protein transport protein [Candidatus Aminicenantes bacterium AH-873-B07]
MKKRKIISQIFYLLIGICTLTSLNFSSGFLIYEFGTAATAQAGAFVARAYDPSAIFYNPAGLGWLSGTQISFGTTLILPFNSLALPNYPDPTWQNIEGEKQTFYPSHFYLTHRLSDKIVFGIGVHTPYGLGTKWPKEFPLRFIAYHSNMKSFFINPTVAYRVNEKFSIGFGLSYIYSDVVIRRKSVVDLSPYGGPPPFEFGIELTGKETSAFGFNFGILYKEEKWSAGLAYRSRTTLGFEGDISYELPIQLPPPLNLLFMEMEGSTDMPLPDLIIGGIAFKITDNLEVEADIQYNIWSVYDKLEIYGDGEKIDEIEENWKDSYVLRIGAEYILNEKFALRFGFLYDQTPQPVETMDPILPDADRYGFTAGFGYKMNNFTLDFAYHYELFKDRESPNRAGDELLRLLYPIPNWITGTYSTYAHIIGITFTYKF